LSLQAAEVMSYNCRSGNHSLKFRIGFNSSARKRRDGTYPPGANYTTRRGTKWVHDPIPIEEFGLGQVETRNESGDRMVHVPFTRSTGRPCWHVHGHVFSYLFNRNSQGHIESGLTHYYGQRGFRLHATRNTPSFYGCGCSLHGLDNYCEREE
jgi:hypothetical protein